MDEVLRMIEIIEDIRQPWKVKHKLLDIVVIVLFAKLANADDWEEIEYCAEYNEDFLKQYIGLENGVPSHDKIERVMGMIDPEYMQKIYEKWNELVNSNEGEKLKKLSVLMEKLCVATQLQPKKQIILYLHGAIQTDFAWDRKL